MKLFKSHKWTKLKTVTPKVNFGDCILFNYAVFAETQNISNKVRISIQVRFNFLDNKLYNFNNYRLQLLNLYQDTKKVIILKK